MSAMRIGGLASGMDIDSIISDLMKAERAPLDKLEQKKQVLEWQQEDYRSLNNQLSTFRESVFELKLERTFNVKTATSSNSSVVEVSASGTALAGTSSIAVTQLAEGAFKTSSSALGSGVDLHTLNTQLGLTGNISFRVNGTDFTINADSESIYDLMAKINDADIGVQASYDSNLDRLFLSTKKTGTDAKIEIVDGTDGSGKNLFSDALKIDTTAVQGKNAAFTLNGAEFTMSSNEFTINGITYTLKGVSATGTDGKPVSTTISVESDTDQIFKTIMDFVDLYNETINKFNSELNEEYYRDYAPLTEAEREKLDEDQIEKWTARAKSGLLKNDSILTGIVSSMRSDVYSIVDGLSAEFNSLADIGITTGGYLEQGKLYVNKEDLRAAIEKDPEAIKKLFTATSKDGSDKNEGIAVRLYNNAVNGISKITRKAGANSDFSLVDNSVIGKRLQSLDEQIEDFEDRLKAIEDRYWKRFTAMEEAINKMNSQSSWLSQYLGIRSS